MLQASCYGVIHYAYPSQVYILSYVQPPVLETFCYLTVSRLCSQAGGSLIGRGWDFEVLPVLQHEEFQWPSERPVWVSVFCVCILGRGER